MDNTKKSISSEAVCGRDPPHGRTRSRIPCGRSIPSAVFASSGNESDQGSELAQVRDQQTRGGPKIGRPVCLLQVPSHTNLHLETHHESLGFTNPSSLTEVPEFNPRATSSPKLATFCNKKFGGDGTPRAPKLLVKMSLPPNIHTCPTHHGQNKLIAEWAVWET